MHPSTPGVVSGDFSTTPWLLQNIKYIIQISQPLKPCTHVETRNIICTFFIRGGVGVGWGGGNNVHVNLNTHGLYGVHRATICISVIWGAVGVGWG